MKRFIAYKFRTFLFLLFATVTANLATAQQTSATDWTAKSARKWVKSREWSNGLPVKISSAVNDIEFAKQYHANKAYWDKAFQFMHEKNLKELAPGKYIIDGDNVFATITEAPSKKFEQSAWESHRQYVDLQYVITAKEKIGVSPLTEATVTKAYDETRDVANYDAAGKYFIASPKAFFLFFPDDVHRPNIKVEGFDTVKKLVIKIKYAN